MPRRVDANQAAIVRALRGVGVSVIDLTQGGSPSIDLICAYRGKVFLIDVKASPTASRTATQQRLVADGVPIAFPTSIEEALRLVGAIQ